MKTFEEFENALRDVNSVKGLCKLMLANGIKNIDVENDILSIKVSPFGVIENANLNDWKLVERDVWDDYTFEAKYENIYLYCDVLKEDIDDFVKATGFVFPRGEH